MRALACAQAPVRVYGFMGGLCGELQACTCLSLAHTRHLHTHTNWSFRFR